MVCTSAGFRLKQTIPGNRRKIAYKKLFNYL